jgi:osmoprotectant transport system substrate-binding protein
MRVTRRDLSTSAAAVGIALCVASCGSPGSSGTSASSAASSSASSNLQACEAVPGDTFVGLVDDKNLQNPDNVIPAVNAQAATDDPEIIAVLDTVSAVLDTSALVDLNKAVDVDRQSSAQAAQAFIEDNGLDSPDSVGEGRKVIVGSPNFSEGATLANLYAEVLNAAGYDASTQDIGNRELYLTDLESGAITVVPEYVSTLTEFLNTKVNGENPEPIATSDLAATVKGLTTLGDGVGLAFGTPADAQDQNSYAVTTGFADKYNIETLSDLAATCGGIVLGGPPECPERTFCQLGLQDVYGLEIGDFVSLDAGGNLTKDALKNGTITLGMILSSDPSLAA